MLTCTKMKKELLIILISMLPGLVFSQTDEPKSKFNSTQIDTSSSPISGQVIRTTFKLNYSHTDGYSNSNRYWFTINITGSLMTLTFKSPENEDWNYINYQKKIVLKDQDLANIKRTVIDAKLSQKNEGFPTPLGSGYGADRLTIESDSTNITGGTDYMSVGNDQSEEDSFKRITLEKKRSATISGDYQSVYELLKGYFTDLLMLIESKDKVF